MIWDLVFCANNLTCHWNNLTNRERNQEPGMVRLCNYFKENKVEMPDYCFVPVRVEPPRKRNEF